MSFMGAVNSCFGQYAGFQGRAPRSEYWYWFLFTILILLVGDVICGAVGHLLGTSVPGLIFQTLFSLAILLPSLAVAVRRLHDLDKSGWWYLLVLVPLVGPIIMLVWFCTPGTRGPNRFGGGMAMGGMSPMPMPVGFN
jgi:uncharacterized membrane protein YhaH (DUF805 family)